LVDHLEPLRPIGIIDTGDLHQLLIFQIRSIAQFLENVRNFITLHGQGDFADMLLHGEDRIAEGLLRGIDHPLVGGSPGDMECDGHGRHLTSFVLSVVEGRSSDACARRASASLSTMEGE